MHSDEDYMRLALQQAQRAMADRHYPCGCVLVSAGSVVAAGRNEVYRRADPTRHGEMVALETAFRALGNDSILLPEVTAYVTAEPCMMCAGAFLQAGIHRVVFGARFPDSGAIPTADLLEQYQLTNRIDWVGGILQEECGNLLRQWSDYKSAVLRQVRDASPAGLEALLAREGLTRARLAAWDWEQRGNATSPPAAATRPMRTR